MKRSGNLIAKDMKDMGTDRGLSQWLFDKVRSENYTLRKISINKLRKMDPDLDHYLKTAKLRKFKGKPFRMYPVITSKGEVLDGYNRIMQQLRNGSKSVYAWVGLK
jgi:hypothetical protein